MQNKLVVILITIVTLVGLGFVGYNSIYPKVHQDLVYDEKEYIVYFYYPSCSYCQQISEDVNDFMENGEVKLIKKNMENYGDKWDSWDVQGTPTMIYVNDGRIHKKVVGPDPCLDLLDRFSE